MPSYVKALAKPLITDAMRSVALLTPNISDVAVPTCDCPDHQGGVHWCKHVAALSFQILQFCEANPFYPFFLRGVDMHKLGKEWILAQNGHTIGKKKSARVVVVIDDPDARARPRPSPPGA